MQMNLQTVQLSGETDVGLAALQECHLVMTSPKCPSAM